MAKLFNISVTYNGSKQVVQGRPSEIAQKSVDFFDLHIDDVNFYNVTKQGKYEIGPSDITDLMKIELVHKKDGQRHLRSNDINSNQQFDRIKGKLRLNSPLSGPERKTLIELLDNYPSLQSKKRKIDEANGYVSPKKIVPTFHKKIQVNISTASLKDSFSQTERVKPPSSSTKNRVELDVTEVMKKLSANENFDKDEAAKLMNESFDDRRNYIYMKMPPVIAIKERYPLLFSFDEIRNELDRIFYPGKYREVLYNMSKLSQIILNNCDLDNAVYVRTMKAKEEAKTPNEESYAEVVGSILALSDSLEKGFRFIHVDDEPHGSEDIYPHIDASGLSIKDLFYDKVTYLIKVEGLDLCKAPTLQEAVLCLIASFFIFNIDYPASCSKTLIAFEKLYLVADDTKDIDQETSQMIKYCQLKAAQLSQKTK